MRRWRLVVAVCFVAGLLLAGILLSDPPTTDVTTEELARRVASSRPAWANYQEDLKGQLGATPVARWEGAPVRATVNGSELQVEFDVVGPWAGYDFGLPILIRDHLGRVYQNGSVSRDDSTVTYVFRLQDRADDSLSPWVEVRYPNGQSRLVFSDDGVWERRTEP